ncbi:hypothetical protein K7432_001043 [Basidiobolus ranarum]|uniref:F-box domain-containing protein n=1 Tax=Basidiobolus ranarum TaxID=34480 RepID=A0ABR2X3N8_9FUNG
MLLPPEILAQIFSYLENPRELHSSVCVCLLWNCVATPILWKSPKPTSAQAVESLTQAFLSSKKQQIYYNKNSLAINVNPNKNPAILTRPCVTHNYGSFVEELNFSACQITQVHIKDSFMQAATSVCSNIIKIDLTNCYKLSDATVSAVSSHCKNLKSFSIAGCASISDSALSTLAQGCPKLQELSVKLCYIDGSSLTPIINGCPELTSLNLSHCQSISRQNLESVFDTGREFESLQLEYCQVTRSVVQKIALHSSRLRHLNLNNVYILADSTIIDLVHRSSQLTYLSVASSSVSDSGILALAQNCRKLKSVNMSYCGGVTSRSVSALATQCSEIEQLSMAYCDNISDMGIVAIANSLPSIRNIDITCCPKISNISVQTLLEKCLVLENLKMAYCAHVTRAAVQDIPAELLELRSFDISGMQDLEDEDIRKIIKKFPKLQALGLKGCSNISDDFWDEMSLEQV